MLPHRALLFYAVVRSLVMNVSGVFSVFVCVELVGLPGSALGALKTGFMPIKKIPSYH